MKKPFKTSRQLKRELSNKPRKPRKVTEFSEFGSLDHKKLTIRVLESEIKTWREQIQRMNTTDADIFDLINKTTNLNYKINNNLIKIKNINKGLPENGLGLGHKYNFIKNGKEDQNY